jgi:hypothetical protein
MGGCKVKLDIMDGPEAVKEIATTWICAVMEFHF